MLKSGQLLHVFSFRLFSFIHDIHYGLAAFDRIYHALDVQHLAPDPQRCLEERILELAYSFLNLKLKIFVLRVCQNLLLVTLVLYQIIQANILKAMQHLVELVVVLGSAFVLLHAVYHGLSRCHVRLLALDERVPELLDFTLIVSLV